MKRNELAASPVLRGLLDDLRAMLDRAEVALVQANWTETVQAVRLAESKGQQLRAEVDRRWQAAEDAERLRAAKSGYEVIRTFPSTSDPGTLYEIRRGKDGVVYCSCPSYPIHRHCSVCNVLLPPQRLRSGGARGWSFPCKHNETDAALPVRGCKHMTAWAEQRGRDIGSFLGAGG